MKLLYSVVLLSFFINKVSSKSIPDGYQLEQIHVMFRHGDRIPDVEEIYETDPYDEYFRNLGNGQLTNIGKQREYQIGKMLRERYGNFIGEYRYNDVYAFSTDYDRTKMSLQLVLAGLYPPVKRNSWSDDVNWSPIPTYYEAVDDNFMMNYYCPAYVKLIKEAYKSADIQGQLIKYNKFFEYIKKNTGVSSQKPFGVVLLFQNIRSVKSMNLTVPNWCSDEVYNKLQEITAIVYNMMTLTHQMSRIVVGPIIEKFLLNLKSNGSVPEQKRKIQLYGGHDINVATFCNTHNFSNIPAIPDYGSAIVLEKLKGPDNNTYIRFLLWTGALETWIQMKLENCDEICSLSIYEKLVASLLPDDSTRHCTLTGHYCEHTKSDMDSINPLGRLTYLVDINSFLSFKHMKKFGTKVVESVVKTVEKIPKSVVDNTKKGFEVFPKIFNNIKSFLFP